MLSGVRDKISKYMPDTMPEYMSDSVLDNMSKYTM